MKKGICYLAICTFTALILVGCASDQSKTQEYNEAKKAAWDFVKEEGWDNTADEDWQSAEVTEVIADQTFELLDDTFEGNEALRVSFKDKENVVTGTPLILIDPDTNEVIGYMPGE
ncbi:hypothetical protein [Jeotgalibacillus salarius]|uniref:Uncharacterized protein n=1 Tax=Jeotgalibacillus salarius TaxID=546023 RepID=A0A4Y8LD44_9BACL|nr:hypothetical protein [Jeotgalibacillus salarius]TFE00604.1 hypothetical protein E2626_11550 [Jeotgalibacillus salarius]